jgi:hypothetical protein
LRRAGKVTEIELLEQILAELRAIRVEQHEQIAWQTAHLVNVSGRVLKRNISPEELVEGVKWEGVLK